MTSDNSISSVEDKPSACEQELSSNARAKKTNEGSDKHEWSALTRTRPIPISELVKPEARQFLHDLIISIPDSVFYEFVADRLNIPLQKSARNVMPEPEDEERQHYTLEYLVDVLFLELAATSES